MLLFHTLQFVCYCYFTIGTLFLSCFRVVRCNEQGGVQGYERCGEGSEKRAAVSTEGDRE